MKEKILAAIDQGTKAVASLRHHVTALETCATILAECFKSGNKLLVAGNGGSLCDAMHFAEELTGYFRAKRRALPAIALADPGHMSCVGNDVGFEHIFARAVEAYGKPGDVLALLTTSGRSSNLLSAYHMARQKGLITLAFLGKGGGALRGLADHEILIDGFATSDRIQEAHMTAIHILIEMVEWLLFHPAIKEAEHVACLG